VVAVQWRYLLGVDAADVLHLAIAIEKDFAAAHAT
jgi:hypothetical protein